MAMMTHIGQEKDGQKAEKPMAALNPLTQVQTAHYQNQITELQQEVEEKIEKKKQ